MRMFHEQASTPVDLAPPFDMLQLTAAIIERERDDPKMLEDRLRELVQETLKTTFDSCSITLTPAADPADKLVMIAVEAVDNSEHTVPHMLTPTAGWTCDDAKNGRFAKITFEYPCKNTPPPPPLQPIQPN